MDVATASMNILILRMSMNLLVLVIDNRKRTNMVLVVATRVNIAMNLYVVSYRMTNVEVCYIASGEKSEL